MGYAWRGLTEAEASAVHRALKDTPNILGYTVAELRRFGRVLVATDADGALAGVCVVKDLALGWSDLAMALVLPPYRGRGIGKALFTRALEATLARGRHAYVLSREPSVIRWMEEAGMATTHSSWRAPLAVHLEMQVHMASRYRWREMTRKMREIPGPWGRFVAGTKKSGPIGPL